MKKLDARSFEEIRRWMYRNARPIDLARWKFHFENGDKATVLEALSAYQNEDGGFGNAIDCDNWNPNSTPYNVGQAIGVFRELELYDPLHPMVQKALHYLETTSCFSDKGWPFTIPSNDAYPHAPWWAYSEENNRQNGYHATGNLAGYILRCGDEKSSLYAKTVMVADGMMEKLRGADVLENHEIGAYGALLCDLLEAGLARRFDGAYLKQRLRAIVDAAIERDAAKWGSYSMRPSMYMRSPENPLYAGNEAVMDMELDYLIDTRHRGGAWDISWVWEDYPKEFAVSERWWQGAHAVWNLLLLKNFGRLNI